MAETSEFRNDTAITKFIDEINKKSSYKSSCLRVAKYDHEQYLKTIEGSTVTIQPDLNIELTEIDKKEVENILINIKVTIQVTSLSCSNCSKDATLDEESIICKKCDAIPLTSNCKTETTVTFTGQIGNDKVLLWVGCLILTEHFKLQNYSWQRPCYVQN